MSQPNKNIFVMRNPFLRNLLITIVIFLIIIIFSMVTIIFTKTKTQNRSDNKNPDNTISIIGNQIDDKSKGIQKILGAENTAKLLNPETLNSTLNEIVTINTTENNVNTDNRFGQNLPNLNNTLNLNSLKSIKIDLNSADFSKTKVEIIDENLKIIQVSVKENLPVVFNSLIIPNASKLQRLNYSFILQNDVLKYLGDDVEFAKKVIIDNNKYIFIEKYETDFGYPRFYLIDINSEKQINVSLPIEVPLDIYNTDKNENHILIEAYNTNGIGAKVVIYEIDLSILLDPKLNPIVSLQNK